MAEKLSSHDELEFTVIDALLANLTLSPPQTSTQLTVVAEPPKPFTKANGRGKRQKQLYVFHSANIKEKKRTAWYSDTCASCGFTANALTNGQR